jgi:hypothetical protein
LRLHPKGFQRNELALVHSLHERFLHPQLPIQAPVVDAFRDVFRKNADQFNSCIADLSDLAAFGVNSQYTSTPTIWIG